MVSDVLIVEDEAKLAELLYDYLSHAGYQCELCADGLEAMELLRQNHYRLLLLDLMLPGLDGISICHQTRQFSTLPIIMLTARIDEEDRLRGLNTGADDYICKPFSPREVVARVKAVLRRADQAAQQPAAATPSDGLRLDEQRLEISIGKQAPLLLTLVEFRLIRALAAQPGCICSRQQLMESIYADHRIVSDRTIDSHIKKLRHKMTAHFEAGDYIDTVYGAGYRLRTP